MCACGKLVGFIADRRRGGKTARNGEDIGRFFAIAVPFGANHAIGRFERCFRIGELFGGSWF